MSGCVCSGSRRFSGARARTAFAMTPPMPISAYATQRSPRTQLSAAGFTITTSCPRRKRWRCLECDRKSKRPGLRRAFLVAAAWPCLEVHAAHAAAARRHRRHAGASSFGGPATIASVVISRPATEAASCSAVRTTLAGSMMPASTMSTYSSVCALKPKVSDLFSRILPTTIEPSTPAFSAIWRIGASSALQHDVDAGLHVGVVVRQLADRLLGAQQRDAAAGDDAFLDRRAGGVERVVDAVLLLLHLDSRSRRRRGSPRRRPRAWPDAPAASPCRSPRWSPRSAP